MRVVMVVVGCVFFVLLLFGAGLYGCPRWGVYSKRLNGQATLQQQEFARRVMIEEAKARRESATLLAEAEVRRAHGVAKANQIIGNSLRENEAYLRYLWIRGLQDGSSEVIYIPTEANLPILEANPRRGSGCGKGK